MGSVEKKLVYNHVQKFGPFDKSSILYGLGIIELKEDKFQVYNYYDEPYYDLSLFSPKPLYPKNISYDFLSRNLKNLFYRLESAIKKLEHRKNIKIVDFNISNQEIKEKEVFAILRSRVFDNFAKGDLVLIGKIKNLNISEFFFQSLANNQQNEIGVILFYPLYYLEVFTKRGSFIFDDIALSFIAKFDIKGDLF